MKATAPGSCSPSLIWKPSRNVRPPPLSLLFPTPLALLGRRTTCTISSEVYWTARTLLTDAESRKAVKRNSVAGSCPMIAHRVSYPMCDRSLLLGITDMILKLRLSAWHYCRPSEWKRREVKFIIISLTLFLKI